MTGPLASAVEFTIFNALLKGEINHEEINRKTLSHLGQKIHQALEKLVKEAGAFDVPGVVMVATEGFGVDRGRLEEYLAQVQKHESVAGASIHRILRERDTLLGMANEIQRQLSTGDLDASKIQRFTPAAQSFPDLTSVDQDLEKGVPDPPHGPDLKSLPSLSGVSNGVYGVYVIAGVPNIGKSTLAAQISVDVARSERVLYYDFENTRNVLLYRLVQNFGLETARAIGKRLYYRENLRSLSRDLAATPPPATVVVDSIQKLSVAGADDKRQGLDAWIRRLEEIKKRGYNVIIVSEINRASYTGDPKMDCFKETGALEYAADTALVLQEGDAGFIKMWVVKNRHYPKKGPVGLIERDAQREYWFREAITGLF